MKKVKKIIFWVLVGFAIIQFIPVDDNQLWPRVDMKGNWIDSNLKSCEIWPFEECPVTDPTVTP